MKVAESTKATEPEIVDEWFAVQWSWKGADDWYAFSGRNDSLATARSRVREAAEGRDDMDWRIVKRVLTETVVEHEQAIQTQTEPAS